MLIQSNFLATGELELIAYSDEKILFESISKKLRNSFIPHIATAIESDEQGRKGRKYIIPDDFIEKLERVLRGTFESDGFFRPDS